MCGYHGPSYNEIVVTAAILPFLAYDVGIGAFSFYSWSRAKKFQSFKALGLAAAVLCCAGGFVFGIWPKEFSHSGDYQRCILMFQIGLAMLFFYPAIDFIFSKKKRWRSYVLKLPVALLGIWLCILVNQHHALPSFMLFGQTSPWDFWIYDRLFRGPSAVPW